MTRFLRSLLPISLVALGFEAQAQTSAQFEAQRQQKYRYSTFSAMGSPVVLPMDGKTQQADWLTGLDVSLADMIFPHLHMDTAYGTSSLPQEELAAGHHDPTQRDGFTLQNIEFGLSGRLNQHNEFFVTLAGNVTPGGQYNPIFEEAFWKFKDLPGGFELAWAACTTASAFKTPTTRMALIGWTSTWSTPACLATIRSPLWVPS